MKCVSYELLAECQAGPRTLDWASDFRDHVQKKLLKCSELRTRGYVRAGKNVSVIKIQLVLVWIRDAGVPKEFSYAYTMP